MQLWNPDVTWNSRNDLLVSLSIDVFRINKVIYVCISYHCHTLWVLRLTQNEYNPDNKVYGANMGADRTQVGPMLAPWILLSGKVLFVAFYIPIRVDLFGKKYKHVWILYHISRLKWRREMKSFLVENMGLYVLHRNTLVVSVIFYNQNIGDKKWMTYAILWR